MSRKLLFFFLVLAGGFAKGQEVLDPRARAKYTQEQIESMSAVKKAQINFYYSQSFELKKTEKCINCPELEPKDIDISKYDNQRQDDHRVGVVNETGQYRIILLSREELNAEYKRIEQVYNSNK